MSLARWEGVKHQPHSHLSKLRSAFVRVRVRVRGRGRVRVHGSGVCVCGGAGAWCGCGCVFGSVRVCGCAFFTC